MRWYGISSVLGLDRMRQPDINRKSGTEVKARLVQTLVTSHWGVIPSRSRSLAVCIKITPKAAMTLSGSK